MAKTRSATAAGRNGVAGRPARAVEPGRRGRVEDCRGVDALTVDRMKELLGWSVVTAEDAGDRTLPPPVLRDSTGRWVRLLRNARNRPFKEAWCRTIMQDVLNRHWRFNAETVIVGENGSLLSGAHRLAAAVLAEEYRTGKNAPRWSTVWPGPVTLECLVFHGLSESDDVTRTLDNTRPRSLSDVLYCDASRFGEVDDPRVRESLCRHLKAAITLMWQRTGAGQDKFHERRTHSETTDLLARHSNLEDCVAHVHSILTPKKGETKRPRLPEDVSLGDAAAMLYLMATSASDGELYRNGDPRTEAGLDFSRWDRACELWRLVVDNHDSVREVRYALNEVAVDPQTNDVCSTKREKLSVFAKAWQRFSIGLPLDRGTCMPDFVRVGNLRQFESAARFGGIDLGDPKADDVERDEDDETDDQTHQGGEPSPQEEAGDAAPGEGDDETGQDVDEGPAADAAGVTDDEDEDRETGDPDAGEIAAAAEGERRRRQEAADVEAEEREATLKIKARRGRSTRVSVPISLDDVDM